MLSACFWVSDVAKSLPGTVSPAGLSNIVLVVVLGFSDHVVLQGGKPRRQARRRSGPNVTPADDGSADFA